MFGSGARGSISLTEYWTFSSFYFDEASSTRAPLQLPCGKCNSAVGVLGAVCQEQGWERYLKNVLQYSY